MKLKQVKYIFYLLFSIFIFILLMPLKGIGEKSLDNRMLNKKAHDTLTSVVINSYYASVSKDPKVPSDTSFRAPEKQENHVRKESKWEVNRGRNEINRVVLWLLGDVNVSELKKYMIDYGNNNLPLFLRKHYIALIERTYTYPIIFLFILLIAILILNITLVLLVLYFTSKKKNYRERYIRIYRNSYEKVLRSYLFSEIEWESAILKLKKLKEPLNRKILTEVLLTFKENLRGEMDNQIPQIFIKLGLERDSLKLAKSAFYFRRIEGLKALTNLDPENAKKIIAIYLNDSHITVRKEAQVSYVRLHPENPFEFLKTMEQPFTRWTQLSAFYIFRLHQVPVPAFVDYLNSDIPTIRNFSLRMIIFFQQLENASAIYKLLDSPIEMTRFLSIRAINDLRLYEGKQMIKKLYQSESGNNQLEIVKTLKNIGNEDDFDFLESIIRLESISLKIEACRSLYYVNSQGRERLNFLNRNSDLKIDQFLAHITDPRN